MVLDSMKEIFDAMEAERAKTDNKRIKGNNVFFIVYLFSYQLLAVSGQS